MIIDTIDNAALYSGLQKGITNAFAYLESADLEHIIPGKYAIDGDQIFAIVQQYQTLDAAVEQMESHKKYIDVQYIISGSELVGLALLRNQVVAKPYEAETDFILYKDAPDFFTVLSAGMFMIFYPSDLHMPCIKIHEPAAVKKIVIKVAV